MKYRPFGLTGQRVELSPSCDWWMKGARYGTIAGYCINKNYVRVQLDKGPKRPVQIHCDLLQPIGEMIKETEDQKWERRSIEQKAVYDAAIADKFANSPFPPEAHNDSGISTEEALALLDKDGVTIDYYGKMTVVVMRQALEEARESFASASDTERQVTKRSIERNLDKALPRMMNGTASKKVCDNAVADLLLWEALRLRALN